MADGCPRHFTTQTSAPTEKSCWRAYCFARRLWPSAFLPKSSLTITTFSSKRTNWFVPRARRCLLNEFFGALGANGTPRQPLGGCCDSLARYVDGQAGSGW